MLPELSSGDFVIASRFYLSIKNNDLLIVNHPVYGIIVKRVIEYHPQNGYRLRGDHTSSVSSEQMGWLSQENIVGKIFFSVTSNRDKTKGDFNI